MLSELMSEEDSRTLKPEKSGNIKNLVSEIFDLFFYPFENIVTSRSGGDKNEILLKAMSYYSEGNYKKASGIFRKLMKKEPDNLLIYFYCGICELALNKAVSSRKFLNKVVTEDKEILNELAGWYLGLSYLKTGNVKSARKIFQGLTSTGKSRDSQNILKKIENL
ncbi:MAG: tetratricopeptide repeat protein [Ignavibacteria bacterium]|nr:tetratricopeptide repeat protein [Ignavibacteria bacterium]